MQVQPSGRVTLDVLRPNTAQACHGAKRIFSCPLYAGVAHHNQSVTRSGAQRDERLYPASAPARVRIAH